MKSQIVENPCLKIITACLRFNDFFFFKVLIAVTFWYLWKTYAMSNVLLNRPVTDSWSITLLIIEVSMYPLTKYGEELTRFMDFFFLMIFFNIW